MQQFFEKYKKQLLRGGVLLLVLITVVASGKQLNVTLLESAIGCHVHFAVTHNDEPMDPGEFLSLS